MSDRRPGEWDRVQRFFTPAEHLGAYQIVAALGGGGTGVVYKAGTGRGQAFPIKPIEPSRAEPSVGVVVLNWPGELEQRLPTN